MSKALELLANIDKKYNSELANTEEQLRKDIEQTSKTIKDSLTTRANITVTAIQQSDEKVAKSIQNSSKTVDEQLKQHEALLTSKLSRLQELNEQIESAESQAQNQSLKKKLSALNIGLILTAVILTMAIFFIGYLNKSKYSELQNLNNVIAEKQATVDHLNKSGGSLNISTCRIPNTKTQRMCIQINTQAGTWNKSFMVPMGY